MTTRKPDPPQTPTPRVRFERLDTPEVAALRRVKVAQPDLAAAVEMQIELVALHRRVQGRISTPFLDLDVDDVACRIAAGTPIVHFEHVPFDWGELRALFRKILDLLRRFEAVEADEYAALQTLVRSGRPEPHEVAKWYHTRAPRRDGTTRAHAAGETLSEVLTLAARPFLARAFEIVHQRIDLSGWSRPYCPFCGGDPELGVITAGDARRLLCGRCTGSWAFDAERCPFCDNQHPGQTTSFISQDGRYRLTACDVCRRYLKSYDARGADRPVMMDVDTIATLPLDAAAIQRGYASS